MKIANYILKDKAPVDWLASLPNLNELLLQLLWQRNVKSEDEIEEFLYPDWHNHIHNPYEFRHMAQAVEMIYGSIQATEKIAVFGDYDADGVTAATILVSTLRKLGAAVEPYLPHREREGYGLNIDAINYLAGKQCKLIITCDCGIANVEQVSHAKGLGLKVIITDHHEPQATLPAAEAILHPNLPDETYPFKYLSGGGVAFKLVQGLVRNERCLWSATDKESWEKWLLDLVCISTVADMVKLKGESRSLTKYGLTVLSKTRNLGLKELFNVASINPFKIDVHTVGFQIAPRINAAGRLDHANAAFALLMSKDQAEAQNLAKALNITNTERQRLTEEMYQQALLQLGQVSPDKALVVAYEPAWPAGLLGLVAGKLSNFYNRPALVITENNGRLVGSGRNNVPVYNLQHNLELCQEYLVNYGGHKDAAGFTLEKKDLDNFLKKINSLSESDLKNFDFTSTILIDLELALSQANWELADNLNLLEPFGLENTKPRFLTKGLLVVQMTTVGATGQHLKLILTNGDITHKFIMFQQGDTSAKLKIGDKIDVVYELGVTEWRDNKELEFKIVNFKMNL